MAPRRPAELYRAPFPLYTVRLHPRRPLAITAGGGGAAKTGIRNGVHFLQLEQIGGQLSASLLHCHDTETRATMTMALAGDVIAAGQDNSCHILRFSLQEPEAPGTAGKDDAMARVAWPCPVPTPAVPLQFPSMKKTLEFRAHDGEIEDIALGPDNKVVTAGRDFQCCVWQQDQLVTGLRWHENLPGIPDKAYRYQACRFGAVEGSAGALRLYTVQVPHKRERRPPPCYLTKWDGKSFLPLLTRPCGSEVVSCLSISDSGTFLGLGTVTGSVAIHIAFSLQRLYYVKEAHGIVVTDVAFVPESRPGRELLGGHEAALLSVAVDSRCKLHLLPTRRSLPVWLLLLLCAGLIVATILLLQLAFPGFL
ncbi:prolactin regulatory element-binding protein [Onychostruthus taczanowskii]|uniref:prolactin regulatory element-binding protein n=1 Tax=Onychostruthus taczanowskii TaxID=356909 RepID=UPI001B8082DC|nr:prolactin regulatory element-binding protein [Onychostruthus taczanowskii]